MDFKIGDKGYGLGLVKPEGVEQKLIGQILTYYENEGIVWARGQAIRPTREQIGEHYPNNEDFLIPCGERLIENQQELLKQGEISSDDCFDNALSAGIHLRNTLIDHYSDKEMFAFVFTWLEEPETEADLIAIARKIAGKTDPAQADAGTIRGDFGRTAGESGLLATKEGRPIRNFVHISDSPQSAERETKVWFPNVEIS